MVQNIDIVVIIYRYTKNMLQNIDNIVLYFELCMKYFYDTKHC